MDKVMILIAVFSANADVYKYFSSLTDHIHICLPPSFTRNEELLRLQMRDIELGLKTDAGTPYLTITLTFRKTNQADALKGTPLF